MRTETWRDGLEYLQDSAIIGICLFTLAPLIWLWVWADIQAAFCCRCGGAQ